MLIFSEQLQNGKILFQINTKTTYISSSHKLYKKQ